MFDSAGKAFFQVLRTAAERRLGRAHPCCAALAAAAQNGDRDAIHTAQAALGALDPPVLAALMADAHKALREDPQALLALWPAGPRVH